MPKRTSSIITTKYLLNVMTNKVYRIETQHIKVGQPLRRIAKQELLDTFGELAVDKPFGFDQDHHPDKQWMINVLFTLNSNHYIFKVQILNDSSKITQEDLKMIRTFNTSLMRQKAGRYFKRSKSQIKSVKETQTREKQVKQQKKLERKVYKINLLKKQIAEAQGTSQRQQSVTRISQE